MYGLDVATGAPRHLVKLQQRPDHSKYAECKVCALNRIAFQQALKRREPPSALKCLRDEQLAHVEENFSERRIVADVRTEMLRRRDSIFGVDDKSGSAWHHLPMPSNQREHKGTTSDYKYRMSLQGNFYPGRGNFYSFVPPMVHCGSNFGGSCMLTTLFQLALAGKLENVSHFMRQSDSGSDNVCWMTFALHCLMVREGVFNEIDWVRLRAGHSHNEADANHRLAMGVFYPKKGVGEGCATPFEFEAKLMKGMQGMNGGMQVLWQMANFDLKAWFNGCVHKDFGHYDSQRWWRFTYDPNLPEHGCVRVTYKTELTDIATSNADEWKPHVAAPSGSLLQKVCLCRQHFPLSALAQPHALTVFRCDLAQVTDPKGLAAVHDPLP